jgi:cardiolipin synthase
MPGGRTVERSAETLGLRRPGPPAATRKGQPLRPFTIPNLIGYARLVALAAFMVLSLGSDSGRDTLGTVCFGIAAGGDYADGMAARLTGQYSRLGALMDPFIDRMVVICGVVVCWHFELLPRWALAVLMIREAVMVIVVAAGLRMGLDISINWAGRLAVWPTMAAIAASLIWNGHLADVLLYIGLAGSLVATALYMRDGIAQFRQLRAAPG